MSSTIKIKDIGSIKMCRRILKEQTTTNPQDVPFYKISTFGGVAENYIPWDIYNEYKQKYAFPNNGAILISAAGTIGKTVVYHGEDAYFQDSNIVWVDNDEQKVSNRYLYYALKLSNWKTTDGSTIKRLYNDNILDLDIPYNGKDEQEKIASVLSTIDDKISTNNKIIKISEKLMREIYDYWFVQFDFPDENSRPYKSSGGEMVYSEKLKREIPKGWKIFNIEDLASSVWGQCPDGVNILDKDERGGDILPYCSGAGDMDGGYIVNCQAATNASRREVEKGTILISVAGTIGKMTIANERISLGRATLGLTPNNKEYNALVWLLLKSFNRRLQTASVGAVQKIINKSNLEEINIALPEEMFNIDILNDALSLIYELSIENKKLNSLRDWLLPMLISGQVKVAN